MDLTKYDLPAFSQGTCPRLCDTLPSATQDRLVCLALGKGYMEAANWTAGRRRHLWSRLRSVLCNWFVGCMYLAMKTEYIQPSVDHSDTLRRERRVD